MSSQPPNSINPSYYRRKDKSLSVLCSNFLKLYNRDGVESIELDDAASRLGVQRRRIYDIVNVLESIGVLSRKVKSRYCWKGFGAIPRALDALKEEGLAENWSTSSCCSSANLSGENHYRGFPNPEIDTEDRTSGSSKSDSRKEKSLGLLAQQFIKLFVCSKVDLVSLDDAAKILLGDIDDPTAMRTKVRRLYDIANVFSSMNLIEKTHHPENRKQAFRWLGLEGGNLKKEPAPDLKVPKKRAFGTEITNTISKKGIIDVSIGSCKNPKETIPLQVRCFSVEGEQEGSLLDQQKKHSSKSFVFGPFTPAVTSKEILQNKNVGRAQNWEQLASYRPPYCNQVTMFRHGNHGTLKLIRRNTSKKSPDVFSVLSDNLTCARLRNSIFQIPVQDEFSYSVYFLGAPLQFTRQDARFGNEITIKHS